MERNHHHDRVRDHDHYPILTRIDRAQEGRRAPFATEPNAADLESIARTLVDEYWNDYALLTGNIPETAFAIVCERLESHRRSLPRAGSRRNHDTDSHHHDRNGTTRSRVA